MTNDNPAATEGLAASARFVRIVGWLLLGAGVIGVLISAAQVVMLSETPPGLAADGRARAVALGLLAVSCVVVVVAAAFIRRRAWARVALFAITILGIVANLVRLVSVRAIAPAPPEAPPEYVSLLRLISIADVALPIVACLVFAWILWRLRSPAVRDQFR